jgi:hypothetical protein
MIAAVIDGAGSAARLHAALFFLTAAHGGQPFFFACGSMVLDLSFVCGFSAGSAEKPQTLEKQSTAL